jgi:hypothetical protein
MFKSLKRITAPSVQLVSTADAKEHLRVTDSDEDDLIDSLVVAATEKLEDHLRQSFIEQTWQIRLDSLPVAGVELPRSPFIVVDQVSYWPVAATTELRGRGAKLVVGASAAVLDQVMASGGSTCRVTDQNGTFEDKNLAGTVTPGTTSTSFSDDGYINDGTYAVDYWENESTVWTRFLDFDVEPSIPAVLRPKDDDVPDVESDQGPPWLINYVAGYGPATTDVPDAIIAAVKGLMTHLFEHRGEDPRQVPIPEFIQYMVSGYVVPHRL